MKVQRAFLFIIVAVLLIDGINAQVPAKFINPADRDISVKPGDDFYAYANGTWIIRSATCET